MKSQSTNWMFIAVWVLVLNGCGSYKQALLHSGLAAVPVEGFPPVTLAVKQEMRAGWVVSWRIMTSPESIDRIIALAKNSNLNTLFIQVRTNADAFYASQLVPRSERLADDDFDPLAYVLEKGHAQGLNLHAWMNVGIAWRSNTPPAAAEHLFNSHPDWVLRDAKGKMAFPDEYDPHPCIMEGLYWVDWGNLAFREHIAAVVKEVAEQYPVDGIHLDFVRYPARMGPMTPGPGYNADTVARFRRETGAEPVEHTRAWDQWRTNQVLETIQCIQKSLKSSSRPVPLSAAVLSSWDLGYGRSWTDFRRALETEALDFAVLMSYHANKDLVWKSILNATESADPQRIVLGLGLYVKGNTPEKTAGEIRLARAHHLKGFSLFSLDDVAVPKLDNYMAQLRHLALPEQADERYAVRDPVWSRIGVIDDQHRAWNLLFFSRNGKTKLVIYQHGLQSLALAVNGQDLPAISFSGRDYVQLDLSAWLLPFAREVAANHDYRLKARAEGPPGSWAEIFAVDYYAED
ncbi:family 10 glycosylhydrolase [candidate division FCPU426 bacterium]|nr:family 10 glycosylhydrolase [candidate division FCPU426 bacterium]